MPFTGIYVQLDVDSFELPTHILNYEQRLEELSISLLLSCMVRVINMVVGNPCVLPTETTQTILCPLCVYNLSKKRSVGKECHVLSKIMYKNAILTIVLKVIHSL